MTETLSVTVEDKIHTITLDRPACHNALNREMLVALADALRDAQGEAHAVILRGAGEEAFSAGIDLDEAFEGGDPALLFALQDASRALSAFDGVTIAALDGHVVGAGLELACGCEMRIGSPNTVGRLPELSLGITLTNGATQTLPATVGRSRAVRMVLDGGPFDAEQLSEFGFLDEVADDPDTRATEWATMAADAPRDALVRTLSAFDAGQSLTGALEREIVDVLAMQVE